MPRLDVHDANAIAMIASAMMVRKMFFMTCMFFWFELIAVTHSCVVCIAKVCAQLTHFEDDFVGGLLF
jgi:hypothetical protein